MFYLCVLLIAVSSAVAFWPRHCAVLACVGWIYKLRSLPHLYGDLGIGIRVSALLLLPAIKNLADFSVALLAMCLTMIIAYLSWRFFEKPIVKFGHSVGY